MKITLNTPLAFYPLREGEPYVDNDPSNLLDGTITLANEIRKIFLVSDNVAFNRLYAFAGQQYINEKMWDLGLCSTRIRHRLSVPMSQEENGYCEPIEISVPGCPVTLAPKHNTELIQCFEGDCKPLSLGVKHVLENGELVLNPMDFTMKNCISLMDLQNLMVKLFCPDVEQSGEPCKMPYSYQMLLQEAMADYPSESSNPVYHKEEFPDDYCKVNGLIPGVSAESYF
ncbi:hypothetical protein KP509_1Z222600 [Ceratopteris richardii]|nr:hypothetical protein KP509_1Z222600 [Ceratopteris richardii]